MSIEPIKRRVVAKTAAYALESRRDRSGTVFTNRGATASVTFTLPPASRCAGWEYFFRPVADYALIVAAKTADTLVAFNDIAADNVGVITSAKMIGTKIEAFCDGTQWFVNVASADGVTGAIATIVTN